MMQINLHNVLTLGNDEKYIVVAKAIHEGNSYDYLLQLSADGKDVTEQATIVKEEIEGNKMYVVEISDEQQLNVLQPLFYQQLES